MYTYSVIEKHHKDEIRSKWIVRCNQKVLNPVKGIYSTSETALARAKRLEKKV